MKLESDRMGALASAFVVAFVLAAW